MPSRPLNPETRGQPAALEPAQQSLLLGLAPKPDAPPKRALSGSLRPRRLWLCLHFQALPLQALRGNEEAARAVFENRQGLRQIVLADGTAKASGITPGLSVNAALALLPALRLEERNPGREERTLRKLAAWAERFTSMVSIEYPALLLLEIGGSLRLFGGLEALRQQIGTGLEARGFSASIAIAPTPLAASWLAKTCRNVCVKDTKHLTGTLSPLSLQCLEWPDSVRESLRGMGVSCIGDCLRLPRQGFARRFGAGRLLQLDRALGRLPDPRVSYRAPERFCQDCELAGEQQDSDLLRAAGRQLLMALERFLTVRQMMVQQVRFSFFHLRAKTTHLTLRRRLAGRSVDRWFELLDLRFDRLTLPAPVIAIRLRSGPGQALQAETDALPFARTDGKQNEVSIAHLLERLHARMGDEAVHGVTLMAEHRPHRTWGRAEAGGGEAPQWPAIFRQSGHPLPRRPLWLLSGPMALASVEGRPSYRGPLTLLTGPERIESGWWDGNGIARDYFVAVNPGGVHLWIYRNRDGERGWYVHGIFA